MHVSLWGAFNAANPTAAFNGCRVSCFALLLARVFLDASWFFQLLRNLRKPQTPQVVAFCVYRVLYILDVCLYFLKLLCVCLLFLYMLDICLHFLFQGANQSLRTRQNWQGERCSNRPTGPGRRHCSTHGRSTSSLIQNPNSLTMSEYELLPCKFQNEGGT